MIVATSRTVLKRLTLSCFACITAAFPLCTAHADLLSRGIVVKQSDGITVRTPTGRIRLEVWSPGIIRESYVTVGPFPPQTSLAVIGAPVKTPWQYIQSQGEVGIKTDSVEVKVLTSTGAVSYFTANGSPIVRESGDGGKALLPIVLPGPTPVNAFSSSLRFVGISDQDFYGLGEHQGHSGSGQTNHLDYRSTSVRLEQDYIDNLDIPLLVSSKGYGIFVNNPASATVNIKGGEELPPGQYLSADGSPGGLTAQYYAGDNFDNFVSSSVDPQIDFNWTDIPPAGLPHDHYSVRWTGYVVAKEGGDYLFTTTSDDGARVWIDGNQIINDWAIHPATTDEASLHFDTGTRHSIRVEFFQSTGGASIKLTCAQPGHDIVWQSEAGKSIDYYFFYGPSLDRVLGEYRTVTGEAPLPPLWALGYWQSKEHYATQQEWLDIASTYRAKQEPIDNIVQDWFYWNPYPWGSHIMDPNRYPDPATAIKTLHDVDHVHIMISVWGKFEPDSLTSPDTNYDTLAARGFLYPPSVLAPARFYDAFNPAARSTYWGFIRDELFNKGFDAWWLDASEPEASLTALRQVETGAGLGALVLNAWPLEHTAAVYEGQRAASPNKRVFILTRSAYAGEQRNAATVWSSDITGQWDVYAHQIPNALDMSLSGIPYWASDTGGFYCNYPGGSSNPAYGELFTRWFQFSAFCPIFRVHGTQTAKELWRFGPSYEPILVKYDKLRYRLLPYIYAQAWTTTRYGGTILRPLVMDFPGDKRARELADEYLFGPSILVCPVTQPGATSRSVYLPAGANWYNFWTGDETFGGRAINSPAPIDTLPLFVRDGSIIPLGPFLQYTNEKPANPIELRIYEGADGKFLLYEDEGVNYNYEKGIYATVPFSWDQSSKTLTIGSRSGAFPGMLRKRTFEIVFVNNKNGGGLNPSIVYKRIDYVGSPINVRAAM
jgi:alpha-D-xyloside xylohydrolase